MGFAISRLPGTREHDDIELDRQDLRRSSNRAGGIEGGISNGQPLLLRVAMKPIATTISPHKTVNLADGPTRADPLRTLGLLPGAARGAGAGSHAGASAGGGH